jgi:Domain of unknown function (DUF6484)
MRAPLDLDPFPNAAAAPQSLDPFAALTRGATAASVDAALPAFAAGVTVALLHGFDALDRPLVSGLQALPGQLVAARSTVALRSAMIGAEVVLVFEGGDPHRPIVLGVVQVPGTVQAPAQSAGLEAATPLSAQVDDERVLIRGEREVVLQCGAASITLTRAGKVIIKGEHILSQSAGYNRIKGSAIDIN